MHFLMIGENKLFLVCKSHPVSNMPLIFSKSQGIGANRSISMTNFTLYKSFECVTHASIMLRTDVHFMRKSIDFLNSCTRLGWGFNARFKSLALFHVILDFSMFNRLQRSDIAYNKNHCLCLPCCVLSENASVNRKTLQKLNQIISVNHNNSSGPYAHWM